MAERERIRLTRVEPEPKKAKAPRAKAGPASEAGEGDESDERWLTVMVNPQWRITYDGLQFRVQQYRMAEESQRVVWLNRGFCRDLDGAICFLARKRIYTIPGTYDFEALQVLTDTLDQSKSQSEAATRERAEKILALKSKT